MPNDMTTPNGEKTNPAATFPALLKQHSAEIARALPKHMDGDRMCRIALTEFRKNPQLAKCEPRSVFAAVVVSSQLGLEPGVMGQAYLVPGYNKRKEIWECQLIPGWQGLSDLATRTGRASVWTGAVFKGDEFEYALGDRPFLTHRPGDEEQTEANLTHVYAVGRIRNSDWPVIEVWTLAKVRKHRDKYNKVGERHYSYENLEMYGRKVALLQVLKYMPKSPEMAAAVDLQNGAARGQGIELERNDKGVLEGVWAIEPDEAAEGQQQGQPGPKEGALPPYEAAAFEKNLASWGKQVTKGQKPDDIIAMLKTKNTLTPEQEARIRALTPAPDANAPASEEMVKALEADAESAGFGKARIAKEAGIKKGDAWTLTHIQRGRAFLANPMGAPE